MPHWPDLLHASKGPNIPPRNSCPWSASLTTRSPLPPCTRASSAFSARGTTWLWKAVAACFPAP
ncbi:MAG: hypothetical protein EBS69_09215, partial [Verrucomicrobia bacterium]|nr:hypothetical protein [Verrucomicrobiota bacterium]